LFAVLALFSVVGCAATLAFARFAKRQRSAQA
jgi:hypothetical protein